MKTQYLPLFRRMQKLQMIRFAGFHGGGVSLYPRVNNRNPNTKVKVEVNWSSFGSIDPRQAIIFKKNLNEAIMIAKKLSYKLTEKEFRELRSYVEDEAWDERKSGPNALGRIF